MSLKTVAMVLLIFGFIVAGNPSLVHANMDGMATNEEMPGCPLMGMNTICQMSPLEHLGMWQNLFAFLPKVEDLLTFLFSLLVFALGVAWFSWLPRGIPKTTRGNCIRQDRIPPFRALQELFSSGILHPKLF